MGLWREMEMMQRLRPVELKDRVLWFEDLMEDCLRFSDKELVIVRNRHQQVLIVSRKGAIEAANFMDLNNKELNEAKTSDSLMNGIQFDLINYELTNCNRNCNFRNSSFPVSFVVKANSKMYQMSCSNSNSIEFLEHTASEEEMVDGSKRNVIFYKVDITDQFSRFESELARGYCLCTEFENGLFKLALKKYGNKIDETTHIDVTS
ncbi:interleukin-18-like isoform X2 [Heptranchias perlo]|uniref:interleukin-18-like isoform X2 n=1 Tax=Heptranchias perlo TaxID=212740 RepID=UPI00355A592E